MQSAERACFPFRQCATQPAAAAVLGWERALGLRQAPGEGPVPLAGSRRGRSENHSQSRGTYAADRRHRSGANQTARVASRDPRDRLKIVHTNNGKYVLTARKSAILKESLRESFALHNEP